MVARSSVLDYDWKRIMEKKERPQVKDILLILAVGALVVGSLVAPGLPRIFYFLKKRNRKMKEKLARFDLRLFKQELKRLASKGMVELAEVKGKTIAKLTEKGKTRVVNYQLENMEINKPKRWDGKWRLVIFDIPNRKKKAREFFREKLKSLGFYRLQESVFIHPFDCRDEICFIRKQLGLTISEVMFLTVEEIEGEKAFIRSLRPR
jgi:CRISPR-associated endonuclease Cas2